MNRIPYLTLTLCQQGGIGYPPVIILLDRWYAVSDSRNGMPEEIRPFMDYQRMWTSPYNHNHTPHYHNQGWVMKKWMKAPRMTWAQVVEKVK